MSQTKEFNELLEKHQLKKTLSRLSVLSVLKSSNAAVSQPELETILGKKTDRVTLYRTLTTFEEKGIIHKVLDFKGTANYAFRSASLNKHQHSDEHAHFNCTVCMNVYCLASVQIPQLTMPIGYTSHAVNFIVYGVCNSCNNGSAMLL
ncbi:Fur family ferric uptake transcriptional regulator [Pedobacter sp. UYP24]